MVFREFFKASAIFLATARAYLSRFLLIAELFFGAYVMSDHIISNNQNHMFDSAYDELGYNNLMRNFGPQICQALRAPHVNEIMLNCDGSLFVEDNTGRMSSLGTLSSAQGKSIIRTAASLKGIEIDANSPIVSLEIPFDGSRFEGLLPPLVRNPIFSIRRHNCLKLTLADLSSRGTISAKQALVLQQAICDHKSILVSGATGSGKTTLVNALINEIETHCPNERIITIEDTPELSVSAPNHSCLYTNDYTDMSRLVRSALRLRPDRIIVGEVRGVEALDLVDALSTGHNGGLCTIHAGSPTQALERLNLLISRNKSAPNNINSLVAQAIEVIVQIKRQPHRHISDIVQLTGFDGSSYQVHALN